MDLLSPPALEGNLLHSRKLKNALLWGCRVWPGFRGVSVVRWAGCRGHANRLN